MKAYVQYALKTFGIGVIAIFCSCKNGHKETDIGITVANSLDFARNEIVEINREDLAEVLKENPEGNIHIKKEGSQKLLRTQWIDKDQDGQFDQLLFPAEVAAKGTTTYSLIVDSAIAETESHVKAYSRFVPERADDYAWENDKVAFRVYGPKGQKEALEGVPGSILSSGVDL